MECLVNSFLIVWDIFFRELTVIRIPTYLLYLFTVWLSISDTVLDFIPAIFFTRVFTTILSSFRAFPSSVASCCLYGAINILLHLLLSILIISGIDLREAGFPPNATLAM